MNKSQIDYCVGRINAILKEKEEALKEEYLISTEKRLSDDEKIALVIRSCPLPVRNRKSGYVECLFDFSEFEHDAVYREGYEDAKNALAEEARRLLDALFLSDSGEALAMIRNFENGKKEEETPHESNDALPGEKKKRSRSHLRH